MFHTQRLAAAIIHDVLSGKTLTDALDRMRQQPEPLTPQQRGAIQDICYGALRQLGELEAILSQLLHRPLSEPQLFTLLIVALFQLRQGRTAPHTVVDHAVKVAAKTGDGRGKGLANAILRNYLRQSEALINKAAAKPRGRYSHPEWWVNIVREAYPKSWEAVLAAGNMHPPMTLRVNQRKATPESYLLLLQAEGIEAHIIPPQAIWLEKPVPVDRLPGFSEGLVSVQDAGAQWAAHLLDVRDGMRVLDACAAPGGKTCHLLELADLHVTALDIDTTRLLRVQQNLDRLGLSADVVTGNAAKPDEWWQGEPFDRILADVPCSATGVARRHPDIKWLRRPEDWPNFTRQQAQMLTSLWGMLKSGGKMLYVTCSIFPSENRDQIAAFLRRQSDARLLSLGTGLPRDGQLLPDAQHDGFYYALLEKA